MFIKDSKRIDEIYNLKGKILYFLKENKERTYICSKDIEEEFNINKSTASFYLSSLEQLKLISRKRQGRKKIISITEDGDSAL
ncbi:MAG: helix-turn-helix transcriptional regulator [Promethearchaeota archaeon]